MTFRDIELKDKKEYFVHYDKVWETIKEFNWSHCIEDLVKGAHIDTLICTLNLYEEYMNLNPSVVDEDFDQGKLTIDAFRIGKLAGYETSTIKKHIQKIKELEILTIKLPLSEYYQGYYTIHLRPSYILTAKPMGLVLNTND
ncbi:hypothetical protein [Aquimarina aggregata]|uniref:hypothetical protein n=1 Tax=Aquimarina aggregata TaxID=1642818 RepID=UPI0024928CD9|nr:hypothetical protein [Aquimarina aggregata]